MFTLERTRSRRRQHEPEIAGRTVAAVGAGAGIAIETDAGNTLAVDTDDPAAVSRFFDGRSGPLDRVVVAGGARVALEVARSAAGRVRDGGTLALAGGTVDPGFAAALAAALAPVRIRVTVTGATVDVDDGGRRFAREV